MLTVVVGATLLAAAIVMLVGFYRIVAEAFHDSAYLGVLVLLVPVVAVVFVLARWSLCWPGTKRLVLGGAVFGLVWVYAVPVVRASGDLARLGKVAEIAEHAHDAPNHCPDSAKADNGYGTFCCTKQGWELIAHGGCSMTYRPTTPCGPSTRGAVEKTVCGTVGPKIAPVDPKIVPIGN